MAARDRLYLVKAVPVECGELKDGSVGRLSREVEGLGSIPVRDDQLPTGERRREADDSRADEELRVNRGVHVRAEEVPGA